MIAFENHGHNLQSPDEDIYKPVLKYLRAEGGKTVYASTFEVDDPISHMKRIDSFEATKQ